MRFLSRIGALPVVAPTDPSRDGSDVSRRAFLQTGAVTAAALMPGARRILDEVPTIPRESGVAFATAREAAASIRKREISSRELTGLMLERIQRYRTSINALATITAETALASAREADTALAHGVSWGPLHGVPITIKDAFEIAGVRTTAGLPALSNYIPKADAAVVERLRRSGAIILGNTNVAAGLGDWQSFNDIFGTTNNPYETSHTAGGSTGGGAAAVAAGLCYLTMGSDIAGSIRVPSHFCGVYGHKPTLGLVSGRGHIPPLPGALPGREDLATYGPLARSAADLRTALEIVAGPDGDEKMAYRWTLPPARRAKLGSYRIGYVLEDGRCPLASDVSDVLSETIAALRRAHVAMAEGWPEGIDRDAQYDAYRLLLFRHTASALRDDAIDSLRQQSASGRSDADIQALAYVAPYSRHLEAEREQRRAQSAWRRYFQSHDAFLLPAAFVAAFPHDHRPLVERTLMTTEGPRPYADLRYWISFASLAGLPATTAPVGFTKHGLPVGVQILGPAYEDATPIDVADKLRAVIGGFVPPALR